MDKPKKGALVVEEKNTTTGPEEQVHAQAYRYFCDACTGIAGVTSLPDSVKTIRCKVCGVSQDCKRMNWIKIV